MALTYNQVIKRIQSLALGHRQVRTFKRGLVQEFLSDKSIPYAAVFLQDSGAAINPDQHSAMFGFRLFFLDLVHVSADAKTNELDVLSDMFSVAMDIVSQMKFPAYNDWVISGANNMQSIVENDGDMNAGWYMDLQVRIMYEQNVCEVPTDIIDYEPETPEDMKLVYDIKYVAGANEMELTIPEIVGKKVLLVTREYSPLYRVSNLPQSTEFTWNDQVLGLGLSTNPGERFLVLYRNY
jgi:hypothetical protein